MADLHLDAFDYKKFFKNKEKRLKLVSLFSFLPTKLYLRVLYRIKIGRKLDLKNPKLYSEKLNWLKINDIHPEYTNFVDKIWIDNWKLYTGYDDIKKNYLEKKSDMKNIKDQILSLYNDQLKGLHSPRLTIFLIGTDRTQLIACNQFPYYDVSLFLSVN